jgi:phospholipase/carboxylesterase
MKEHNPLGFTHCFEPASQAGAPALLLLHGSGGDETSLLPLGRAIAPGAALLSPRGNATDHGTPRFFARPSDPSGADSEIRTRIAELAAFAQAASKHYKLRQPLVIAGFSHGANMGLHLLLHSEMRSAGVILMRGMAVNHPVPSRHLRSTPVLILSGIHDPLVQTDQVAELATQLREAGAAVTLHWEETGHNLCQGDILMAFDWIRRFYHTPRSASNSQ